MYGGGMYGGGGMMGGPVRRFLLRPRAPLRGISPPLRPRPHPLAPRRRWDRKTRITRPARREAGWRAALPPSPSLPSPPLPPARHPSSPPASPRTPQGFLHGLHSALSIMGRISFLVDENTQALHFFITAMLQLFDRAGTLYGELARFILRLLGIRPRKRAGGGAGAAGAQGKGAPPTVGDAEAAWGEVQGGHHGGMMVPAHQQQGAFHHGAAAHQRPFFP